MIRTALFLASTILLGACWDLPPGDKTSPYFYSDVFLTKYADELVVDTLEPGPEALSEPRAVLLITGVTIREQWFDPIVARLERDGFVPYVWEPPALLSGSLFEATDDLADVVDALLEETGQTQIDILAECTGGVVARHYIQSLGGASKVSRLVTFVSPHAGIDKAPMAAMIAGWPALYDLSPGSDFLAAVHALPIPAEVPFTSIYTCTDEYIQPYQGSIVEGATNIGLCDGFVGHFETFYDPEIYLIMHAALTAPTGNETVTETETETGANGGTEAEPGTGPDDEGGSNTEGGIEVESRRDLAPDDQSEVPAGAESTLPVQTPAQHLDPADDLGCSSGRGGAGWLWLTVSLAWWSLRRRRVGAQSVAA